MTSAEAALIARTELAGCAPWRGDGAPAAGTFDAAVVCEPDDGATAQLTIAGYGQLDTLQEAWTERMAAMDPRLEQRAAACDEGVVGQRRWGFGRLACGVEDGTAVITWTDTRSRLLASAHGRDEDIGELYAWWQENAKPIGRVAREDRPRSPRASDRPSARGARTITGVLCSNLDQPIVDAHGRTWGIQRVRFLQRPGRERIAFVLRRIDGQGQGTEVTVERMPVADVAADVPGAQRPGRGRTALVVRMQGVTQAPDLRSFRPQGLDQVKELSIVPGTRSRTAILALRRDAWYQVRIPAFAASASGNEDRAEIFIDIPR